MDEDHSHEPKSTPSSFVAETIARDHQRYLSFVRRRVSQNEIAEDILQECTIRALEKAHTLQERLAFEGWFFRIIRNAIIDFRRRNTVEVRGKDGFFGQVEDCAEAQERVAHPCHCVVPLMGELKDEYRNVLQRVEIEEQKVREFAEQEGISPSNAGVRVYRARAALKRQVETMCGTCATAGCHDCCCPKS